MGNLDNRFEDLLKQIEEISKTLDERLKKGHITQYEYEEIKTGNFIYDEEKDPIELFKELYVKRMPIKCSELLLDIYDKHKESFRKAVMIGECFPDPLGYKYNQELQEFTILVINRAFKLADSNGYPREFLIELSQLYLAFTLFNHNNLRNTEKLDRCDFMKFPLAEQLRMLFIFLQNQHRLGVELRNKENEKQDFITGMESNISNQSPNLNSNMLVSYVDSFEGMVEAYDILIRYLYFKKSKDYKNKIIPTHGNITHIRIPSLELITYLSIQRNLLVKTWEKFKYSQWVIGVQEENKKDVYIFRPKLVEEYKEHIIAINRRQYSLMLNIFKTYNKESVSKSSEIISKISSEIDKDEIKTLFSINKKDYFCAVKTFQSIINSYKLNMHSYYLELTIDGLKVKDIFKVFELLQVLGECYKESVYKDFDPEDMNFYKYLCPLIPINYFIKSLVDYYDFNEEYSLKLINCFSFKSGINGESDIFSRPLIMVNLEQIAFCPVLIQQMNLERIIEMLISNFDVNISRIGIDFENRIKVYLSYLSRIKVNTSKIEFLASDGRDIEFDFIGTFDNHLMLWEFKAMTVPYSDKKLFQCKKTIMEGIEQIKRRVRIINTDWKKIRELANIELPEEPFPEDKIIKLVGTNVFDFTALVYGEDITVIDESTLLKFFINPEIQIVNLNDKKVLKSKRLWESNEPTAKEFIQYLKNPVTTSPYDECIEAFPKAFNFFEDDYPYGIIDQILTKDPYGQEIGQTIKFNSSAYLNKKIKKKKSIKKKKKNLKKRK